MTPERWRQIEELYHSAQERAPAEREALLSQADPQLRREVEAMLAQDAPGKILDLPAKDALTDSSLTMVAVGSQLGPYQIEALLGAGGMGQVYRGLDTRLDRRVAIKVSREPFSARFEREARAISALNHPHICTLYDVGPNYLVMELVEGETLAAKLKKGKLSIDDTLLYGGQIAAALAEAHSKGITHRDLKPGNIMIGKNGVKVLDFGLAKSARDETLTTSNAIMGSPAYMAPEQMEGKACDARTDLYALGLVLREMATGRRDGTTLDLPMQLAHVIDRCLAANPEDRWHSARDVQLELAWAPPQSVQPVDSVPRHRKMPSMVAAVAALVAATAAIGSWYTARHIPLRPLIHIDAEVPSETPLARGGPGGAILALSPDGSRLALTLRGEDGTVRLYTRRLDESQATPLSGTENASTPFFSPDGEWIGFYADGKLKKISVTGGAAVTLCDAPGLRGASWGDDGNIIAALNNAGVLSRIPFGGGKPIPVTKLNPGENSHRYPQVLPGSRAALFTAWQAQGQDLSDATIDVVSLDTGERKTVQPAGLSPRYLATSNRIGHVIYLHQGTLFAVPFDPGRLALAGVPAPIVEDVSSSVIGGGDFAFSGTPSGPGSFLYLAGKGQGVGSLISWLDRAGKSQPLYGARGSNYVTPRFSPDGKQLAFSTYSGSGADSSGADIWVKDLDRDALSRLSFLGGANRWPVWTPDGKSIVFLSVNSPAPGLYWIGSDGSGGAQRLTDTIEWPYSFSPDGKRLAYYAGNANGKTDIFTAPIEGEPGHPQLGKPDPFLRNGAQPALSPDGRWLAYVSNESGANEVYVRSFPGPGGQWQISIGGGILPLWSRDGLELVYEAPDRRVMAVGYTANGYSFIPGQPRIWAETQLQPVLGGIGTVANYDLAPDGKHVAAILADDKAATRLTFLLNFFDELRRRAPVH